MSPVKEWTREAEALSGRWNLPATGQLDSSTAFREDWETGRPLPSGVLTHTLSVKRVAAPAQVEREPNERQSDTDAVLDLTANDVVTRESSPPRRFPASFAALRALRSDRSPAGWSEAASTLKRDAVRLRRSPYGRHASVLLAVADALTFTEPSDPRITSQAAAMLDHCLALLTEPHISEPAEEALLVDLLSEGWSLTPFVDESRPEV